MIEAEQGGPEGWLQKVNAADKKLGSSGIYSDQKGAGDCPRVRAVSIHERCGVLYPQLVAL